MKKGIKALLITLACLLLVGGGVYCVVRFGKKKPIEVINASNWMLSYSPNQTYLYGTVSSDESQVVYGNADKKVLELYVNEGDSVHIGDPLIQYDTTLDNLNLEEKRLNREKLYNELQNYYKEYLKYARVAYERTVPTATPTPSPSPTAQSAQGASFRGEGLQVIRLSQVQRALDKPSGGDGSPGNPYLYSASDGDRVTKSFIEALLSEASQSGATVYAAIFAPSSRVDVYARPDGVTGFTVTALDAIGTIPNFEAPLSGDGSSASPYIYAYCSGTAVPETFLATMAQEAVSNYQDVYVVLEARGFLVKLCFYKDNGYSFTVGSPAPTPTPGGVTPTPYPLPTEEVTPTPYSGGGMSKAEREAYAKELAKTIRDKELEYRQLSLDIQQLEINGAEGILYSTIDGTVMTASSAANAGETLLEIRGGSGAHISCILGEMDLDKYPVGTAVDGFAYQSGSSLTARIVSVGTMPITENYSNGGNSNNSGYLAVLQVDEDVSLSIGEYVEFSTATRLSDNGTVYLHAAFIREIDGQDCIFIARDGFLKKTPVLTGKRVDEYIELIGCELTTDDYIAFPYDKLAKDGAPVTIPEGNNYGW